MNLELRPATPFVPPVVPRVLQMVLLGTGEPVELIHVEDDEDVRRFCVERPCGTRLLIVEEQLGCRGFRLN
ncbi:MAG TPA: hypothetical protein VHL31_02370 [Geminicoccus sp.]|uniref:hypothetical protein n=1 Tax=Geminicoccus sp. TaxID=2024832 RepID=UPI002E2EE173|nr:hypothetical protein [Geminicoccus sp.]HEX2525130.1 hypothetical protein [Geminicoccus sp.]